MKKMKNDFPWDIKNPEQYGVHFGPYDDSRFKPSRRFMFNAGIPIMLKVVGPFYTSSRVSVIGKPLEDELTSTGRGVIYAHWHRYAQYYYMYASHKRHVIMSSHKDSGEVGARTMRAVGILTVRGAPRKVKRDGRIKEKQGKEALSAMIKLMQKEGFHAGLTVDGPSGPPLVLKKGLVHLARESGSPIMVMSAAARPHFILPTWDRMWMPAPFSRIAYIFTGPFYVPKDADDEKIEEIRIEIEEHMRVWAGRAELYWKDARLRDELGEPVKIEPYFSPEL